MQGLNAGTVFATLTLYNDQFKKSLAESNASLKASTSQMNKDFGAVRGELDKLSNGLIAVGAIGVTGLALATKAAMAFEKEMRNVNSISKLSETGFQNLSKEVIALSKEMPQTADVLAKGLYDIASSGFQGAAGMQVLRASALGATAGVTSTAVAAKGITAVLNAYGQSASQAADVNDILFKTVEKGVLTYEELSSNLGDVVSTSSAAKVAFEQVAAGYATMTRGGISAAEATTSLNRLMLEFIQPTEQMAAALKAYGYESGAALLESEGLAGAVAFLQKITGGSIEKFGALKMETRAMKAALSLTREEGKAFAEDLDAIADPAARAGAAQAAFSEQSKSAAVQFEKAKAQLVAAGIELGSNFLPLVVKGTEAVGNLSGWLGKVPPTLALWTVALPLVAGVGLKFVLFLIDANVKLKAVNLSLIGTRLAMLALNPATLTIVAALGLAAGAWYLYNKAQNKAIDAAKAEQQQSELVVKKLDTLRAKREAQAAELQNLANQYDALSKKTKKSAADTGELAELKEKLQGRMARIRTELGQQSIAWDGTTSSIKRAVAALTDYTAIERESAIATATVEKKQARTAYEEAKKRLDDAKFGRGIVVPTLRRIDMALGGSSLENLSPNDKLAQKDAKEDERKAYWDMLRAEERETELIAAAKNPNWKPSSAGTGNATTNPMSGLGGSGTWTPGGDEDKKKEPKLSIREKLDADLLVILRQAKAAKTAGTEYDQLQAKFQRYQQALGEYLDAGLATTDSRVKSVVESLKKLQPLLTAREEAKKAADKAKADAEEQDKLIERLQEELPDIARRIADQRVALTETLTDDLELAQAREETARAAMESAKAKLATDTKNVELQHAAATAESDHQQAIEHRNSVEKQRSDEIARQTEEIKRQNSEYAQALATWQQADDLKERLRIQAMLNGIDEDALRIKADSTEYSWDDVEAGEQAVKHRNDELSIAKSNLAIAWARGANAKTLFDFSLAIAEAENKAKSSAQSLLNFKEKMVEQDARELELANEIARAEWDRADAQRDRLKDITDQQELLKREGMRAAGTWTDADDLNEKLKQRDDVASGIAQYEALLANKQAFAMMGLGAIAGEDGALTEQMQLALEKLRIQLLQLDNEIADNRRKNVDKTLQDWQDSYGRFGDALWDFTRDRNSVKRYFQEVLQEAASARWAETWQKFTKRPTDENGKATGGSQLDALLSRIGIKPDSVLGKMTDLSKALPVIAAYGGIAGDTTTNRREGAINGAMSGGMAGFTVGGPIGAAVGAALGGLFGGREARKRAEEDARRLMEQQLAELQKIRNSLLPVSDYFRSAMLSALPGSRYFGPGTDVATGYAAATSRGVR